jgi:hypothetical protein
MSYNTGTNCELLYSNLVSGINKNTFNTEQNVNDVTTMKVPAVIPAKYFYPNNANGVGKGIGIIVRGILSCTATPTFTPTVRLGATAGATTGAVILGAAVGITMQSGVTNQPFKISGEFFLTAIGGPGANSSGRGFGEIECGGFASPFRAGMYGNAALPGDVSGIDWNIDNFVNVNFNCNTSNAANIVQLHQVELYGLN